MQMKLVVGSLLVLLITGCASSAKKYGSSAEWVAESKTGQRLPLGNQAGEWSEAKRFQVAGGGIIEVKSEFVKHHGSTCHFNVSFTNVGTNAVDVVAGVTSPEKLNIYTHNSARLKLAPGKNSTYDDLEARECPIRFGSSKEMNACAACGPWVQFANKFSN